MERCRRCGARWGTHSQQQRARRHAGVNRQEAGARDEGSARKQLRSQLGNTPAVASLLRPTGRATGRSTRETTAILEVVRREDERGLGTGYVTSSYSARCVFRVGDRRAGGPDQPKRAYGNNSVGVEFRKIATGVMEAGDPQRGRGTCCQAIFSSCAIFFERGRCIRQKARLGGVE